MSRRLLILYGSETGTAADLAHELSRLVERHHFLPRASQHQRSRRPTRCRRGRSWKKIPTDWLKGTCFTTFGCGDSTYAGFNWAVRKLHRRLLQVGAVEVAERGEGDEQHADGIDGAFLPWSSRLLEVLLERYPLPEGVAPIPKEVLLPPKWVLELAERRAAHQDHAAHARLLRTGRHHLPTAQEPPRRRGPPPRAAVLAVHRRPPLQLLPNPAVPTAALPPSPIPNPVSPLTLRTLLTHHVDITAIPRRSFFATIAALTTDDTHAERLREFTDPQYTDELYDYTTRPRRSILEVLQEFSTVAIPLDRILEVFPPLHERRFSIASPPTTEPEVEILVAVVKYRTIIKKIREGVCTRWLAALKPGAEVTVAFQRGGLGDAAGRPAVMVAPGTGVAPMRALGADFFFRGEWEALEERGAVRVFTAFSRDQKSKSGRMPSAVREALVEVFEKWGSMGREEAEEFLKMLETDGRWRQETWG
ncbi:uncharacterized protein LAJ45_09446 [Morchella importuna]|uniref:uncharacterized protein n=1 Tax=Morchella importuna TaxID=1174673 RepID=UPI001E8EE9A0|nr:uncharacterized protein LAJ45_09446 [Morchella importuna]KAH8146500.1 hypothetical protein LAJ45_09446 [Morchella importuna]